MPEIICNLRKFRLSKDITQDQLADLLSVTRQTINAIEQGKYQPTLLLAYKCAKFFEVKIEDIFTFNN